MFRTKWTDWYDSLPEHTKIYLKNQPIWYDRDMFKAFAFGVFIGLLIGVVL